MPDDYITVISFEKKIHDISNFASLPANVRQVIREAERMESRGFQELLGFRDRKLLWSAGGYWYNGVGEQFHIASFGCVNIQWSEHQSPPGGNV